jgi:hypothetical protein
MKTKNLIDEAIALPIEEKAILIDLLIKSLNPREAEIEKKWLKVAKKRLTELYSGNVKAKSGEDVFIEVWKKFE